MTSSNQAIMETSPVAAEVELRFVQALFRRIFHRGLSALKDGQVIIQDGQATRCFGDPHAPLRAHVRVHHPRFYRRSVLGGGLGVSESLLDGDWSCDDLTSLVRIFIRNLQVSDRMDQGLAWMRRSLARLGHAVRRNSRAGAVRNIHQHYDLGNDFYRLFLDETMNYSCGLFEPGATTMYDASVRKMDAICRKLDLQKTDHVVEIGTGWGALAIYAAENFGCRVTTTTISQEQFDFAVERVQKAGLADQITVLQRDYRDLRGQFDKLVSVEMIEAVGHEFFGTFFRKCSELLRPEGMLLLQSIVIKDQRYKDHLQSVDFIRKYIFPGGCLPSVSVLLQTMTHETDMRLLQMEDIAPHYVQTLRCWRQAFHQNLDEVFELGYSPSFVRMWDYYLCYCTAAFEERQCNNVQMLFAKPACRLDPRGFTSKSFDQEVFSERSCATSVPSDGASL